MANKTANAVAVRYTDSMDPASEATSTAYHEAGHAVLALALGRPVHQVSVLPNQEYLGTCAFGKAPFRPSEDWLEREILIALGGIAAEALSGPGPVVVWLRVEGRLGQKTPLAPRGMAEQIRRLRQALGA